MPGKKLNPRRMTVGSKYATQKKSIVAPFEEAEKSLKRAKWRLGKWSKWKLNARQEKNLSGRNESRRLNFGGGN